MITIRDYQDDNSLDVASVCTLNYEKGFGLAKLIRNRWLKGMMKKGLSGFVAYDNETPVGFFEYCPIEEAPDRVKGRDLIYIVCGLVHLWDRPQRRRYTGKGIGRRLIEGIEQVARKKAKGIVAWGYDWGNWFMPAGFFKHLGYEEVDRDGRRLLLWRCFKRYVRPPQFVRKGYIFKPVTGKIVIDILVSEQCPFFINLVSKWQKVIKGLGPHYRARIHRLSSNRDFQRFGLGMAILINGRPVPLGPMSEERIREIIVKEGG
ncbi:MAG TPA: N-acetyltransferase [bacterium (Candidatus Stahlbacteria)]|nr:N-acetyltransferase [Candidatus Stahlbacteria bacterium]